MANVQRVSIPEGASKVLHFSRQTIEQDADGITFDALVSGQITDSTSLQVATDIQASPWFDVNVDWPDQGRPWITFSASGVSDYTLSFRTPYMWEIMEMTSSLEGHEAIESSGFTCSNLVPDMEYYLFLGVFPDSWGDPAEFDLKFSSEIGSQILHFAEGGGYLLSCPIVWWWRHEQRKAYRRASGRIRQSQVVTTVGTERFHTARRVGAGPNDRCHVHCRGRESTCEGQRKCDSARRQRRPGIRSGSIVVTTPKGVAA